MRVESSGLSFPSWKRLHDMTEGGITFATLYTSCHVVFSCIYEMWSGTLPRIGTILMNLQRCVRLYYNAVS